MVGLKKLSVKKVISLSFLLFANAIILVHSVVFHHHDSQQFAVICAENQKHDCNEHTKQKKHCDHENHSKNSCCVIENCLLSNLFTKTDRFKLTKPIVSNFDIIINNIPVYKTVQITDLAGLPFRQNPFVPLFYSEFISQSIGLRAPPVC